MSTSRLKIVKLEKQPNYRDFAEKNAEDAREFAILYKQKLKDYLFSVMQEQKLNLLLAIPEVFREDIRAFGSDEYNLDIEDRLISFYEKLTKWLDNPSNKTKLAFVQLRDLKKELEKYAYITDDLVEEGDFLEEPDIGTGDSISSADLILLKGMLDDPLQALKNEGVASRHPPGDVNDRGVNYHKAFGLKKRHAREEIDIVDLIEEVRAYETTSPFFSGYNSVTIKELVKLASGPKVLFATIPDSVDQNNLEKQVARIRAEAKDKDNHLPVVCKYQDQIYLYGCGKLPEIRVVNKAKGEQLLNHFPKNPGGVVFRKVIDLSDDFFTLINERDMKGKSIYGGCLSQPISQNQIQEILNKEKWTQRDRRNRLFSYTQEAQNKGVKDPKKSYSTDDVIVNLRHKFKGF